MAPSIRIVSSMSAGCATRSKSKSHRPPEAFDTLSSTRVRIVLSGSNTSFTRHRPGGGRGGASSTTTDSAAPSISCASGAAMTWRRTVSSSVRLTAPARASSKVCLRLSRALHTNLPRCTQLLASATPTMGKTQRKPSPATTCTWHLCSSILRGAKIRGMSSSLKGGSTSGSSGGRRSWNACTRSGSLVSLNTSDAITSSDVRRGFRNRITCDDDCMTVDDTLVTSISLGGSPRPLHSKTHVPASGWSKTTSPSSSSLPSDAGVYIRSKVPTP
mmetsp:Transcript_61727/g.151962  ORF Transcript_61727/g.151962 Transcript_61727/m.151962 type:complete len:273 (-) Transcript_61727:228-1046(-)